MQDNVLLLQDLLNQASLAEEQVRSVPGLILKFAFSFVFIKCASAARARLDDFQ
jgi:hypothetical protein